MIRTQVYFEEEQKKDLAFLAAKRKMKLSQVFRDAMSVGIKTLMNQERKIFRRDLWKKFTELGVKGGGKFMSRDIDKILYEDPYK